jgi:GT2 family glycosyltransferase
MDVSIVILSWNARTCLVKCLRSTEETRGNLTLEALVADNASFDGSSKAVAGQFPWVQLIQTGANLGFDRGSNVGIVRSMGRYVCLINSMSFSSHVFLLNGFTQRLVEFMDAHPTVDLAEPRIRNAAERFRSRCADRRACGSTGGRCFLWTWRRCSVRFCPAWRSAYKGTMTFQKRRMVGTESPRAREIAGESRGRPPLRTTTGRIRPTWLDNQCPRRDEPQSYLPHYIDIVDERE